MSDFDAASDASNPTPFQREAVQESTSPATAEIATVPETTDEEAAATEVQQSLNEPARVVRQSKSFWREILETVIMTIVIFFIIKALIANFRIVGTSMEPNYHTNQLILVNKASYFHFDLNAWLRFVPGVKADGQNVIWPFGGAHRGDIIVLEPPDAPTDDYIKRVIGLPGEKVEVKGGIVYINDTPLNEPYIKEKAFNPYGPVTVPNDAFFVMGDNRNGSRDSRSFGFLPFDKVIGKAMIVYWPTGDGWGPIPDPKY